MEQYISKSAVKAGLERIEYETNYEPFTEEVLGKRKVCKDIKDFIETLEVKEVDLNNGIQLTWEDIRELYIIFAEVDVDIELCKTTDIQAETIGYYQEVLKRFKARKGE